MKKSIFVLVLATVVVFFSVSLSHSDLTTKQITDRPYPDWVPQINDSGHVVWLGFDGSDEEIFFYDGTTLTQVAGNSYDDLYPQINNSGHVVWEGYDGSDWQIFLAKLSKLPVDFGTSGLWAYENGSWKKLNSEDVAHIAVYDGKLVADFGSSWGLWQYDGTSWKRLTAVDPDNTGNCMVVYDGGLAIDFGSAGLWHWSGSTWKELNGEDVEYLAAYGGKLVGDFGSTWGLWEYDGSLWQRLTTADPDNSGNCMVAE